MCYGISTLNNKEEDAFSLHYTTDSRI
jgi:hypothetical protein